MGSLGGPEIPEAIAVHLRNTPGLVGVGERAYPRLGPALLCAQYRIICSIATLDLDAIRHWAQVECFQETFPHLELPSDTYSILSRMDSLANTRILEPGSRLVLYRQTSQIRDMARRRGWEVLANPPETRLNWDHKCRFRERLLSMGLPALQFESLELKSLGPEKCCELMDRWGAPLVVQIPCFPQGGGRSSFVVREPDEILELRGSWGNGTHRGHSFGSVMLSPFLDGISLSMEGCVTPWGIAVSPLQVQLVDIPEVLPPGGFGRFCGHQWGDGIAGAGWVEETARIITMQVGRAMAREGYRGLFGLDFLLERGGGALRVLECNPRYTGAFPTLTLLQLAQGVLPLELFHLLSWLEEPCLKEDPEILEKTHMGLSPAAQVLLFHRSQERARITRELHSGLYSWIEEEARAKRIGPALPFPVFPVPPSQFLVLDGPPHPGHTLRQGSELERLTRLIFFRNILGQQSGTLSRDALKVIKWVYENMGLEAS